MPTKQKRLGRIYLFEINQDTSELNPVQTLDTSGILDQKWCYHTIKGYPVLAVVTSEGLLQLYQLLGTNGIRNLKLWIEYSIGQDVLALSLDWSTNKAASDEPMVVVSDSAGSVTLLKIVGAGFQKIETWNSHGYDEKARLWDTRSLKRCVSETPVGGGVWRLKWHPTDPGTVLAACMYGGFRVLGVNDPEISVLCEYLEHESIAYGADWKFNQSGLVATCSFYDCSMHISQIDIIH
ncbi:hypothetical protein MSG28_003888 [Choristoneura fumiferana]|uniref:Uncharacterized protein n=1 Tax=Choristoneura fumiferana TaxID=7141 RepID=A0ACC0KGK7_CHOFU|nr:hypothetical protein MSG28_003888 [Choristoneura fumiferana]